MDMAAWGPMVAFVTASTITPGPNSIMIMASGVNFDFRKTIPHTLGVAVGITVVITLAGIGLGGLLELFPALRTALIMISATYLLYLAWRIANAAPTAPKSTGGRPFSFLQALTFQPVNAKVWALGMAAVSFFTPSYAAMNVTFVALTFALVGLFSNSAYRWLRHWDAHL